MYLSDVQAIGIKVETTQNTAVSLSATDFIQAFDVKVKPEKEVIKREVKTSTLDTRAHVTGQRYFSISFKAELKTSGAAGTAYAPLGAAIQACAFVETVSGGVSVTYAPTSAAASANFFGAGKSCTIKYYKAGKLRTLAGCLGNMKVVGSKPGGLVVLEFDFKGIYAAVTDASIPTQTYLAALPPIWESASSSFMGVSGDIFKSFTFDCGNTVALREDGKSAAGVKGFVITKREPKFSVVVEDELVATHDYFGKWVAGTEAQTVQTVGTSAGQTTTITVPKCQIESLEETDVEGIACLNIAGQCNLSSGDDWMTILMT